MTKNWTRRKFLESTLKGSVVAGSTITAGAAARFGTPGRQEPENSIRGLDEPQRKLLRVAMDEIIPAGDGMPAASEVGGVEYLNQLAGHSPKIRREIQRSLAALAALSRTQEGQEFTSLPRGKRIAVLKKFEARRSPQNFIRLRDYIYEAYYTQPAVWKLLGYSFYPTNGPGPHMKPFDPSSLNAVRKRGRLYREVS